jgi:hypothetical protein
MAEVGSMAAAISAADRTLSLVIQFFRLISKPTAFGSSTGNGEATRLIKGTYSHVVSTAREVGGSHDHKFRR